MNRKRLHTGCRIFVQLILVTSLLTVTFVQFLKLKKETTNVGISYNDGKQDLEFPSITFCPVIWKNRPENFTFEEFMEHALNFSDFFESAFQDTYLPCTYLQNLHYLELRIELNSLDLILKGHRHS